MARLPTAEGWLRCAVLRPRPRRNNYDCVPAKAGMVRTESGPSASTEYAYRGVDAAFLENDHLRVMVLPGKGGDVLEFRDNRTDVDVLWHADHNWEPPGERYVPSVGRTTWLDHYPGGWQVNLPVAGDGTENPGSEYGLHGESALLPWDATVTRDDDEAVTLRLTTELVRYPFTLEREIRLPAGEPRLAVDERVTNEGGVELEYAWQQHLTLGRPVLGPSARLDLPASRGVTETAAEPFQHGRLADEESFDWPEAPTRDGGTVDLRAVPPEERGYHDQCYATDLEAGWSRGPCRTSRRRSRPSWSGTARGTVPRLARRWRDRRCRRRCPARRTGRRPRRRAPGRRLDR